MVHGEGAGFATKLGGWHMGKVRGEGLATESWVSARDEDDRPVAMAVRPLLVEVSRQVLDKGGLGGGVYSVRWEVGA